MAGVKGKSGGPRKNSGGARPGAGRKPKSANGAVEVQLEQQPGGGALRRARSKPVEQEDQDMLTLLQNIALGKVDATPAQVKAAVAAVQYTHAKKGEGGKKEERQKKAETIGGRFTPTAAPRPRIN